MKMRFLNITVDNLTMDEAISSIDNLIQHSERSYIVTPNMDHIVQIENDPLFCEIYNNADLVLTDGKPLLWISNYLHTPIKEKISGSDIFPHICSLASKKGYSIFILGAAEGVAARAADILTKTYPGLNIVGTYSPPFGFEKDESEVDRIIAKINNSKADILAVSLGSPKGEKFIYRFKDKICCRLSISIGATIDFIAGNVRRAPKWISDIGFEWLYRITQDPKRLTRRYWNDAKKILPIINKYKRFSNENIN